MTSYQKTKKIDPLSKKVKRSSKKFKKDTLRKLIIQLSQKPQILTYKGSGIIADKALVLELLKDAIDYRGQHTSGTGKRPNKDEAEFVLHTTIYLWNLFEK